MKRNDETTRQSEAEQNETNIWRCARMPKIVINLG